MMFTRHMPAESGAITLLLSRNLIFVLLTHVKDFCGIWVPVVFLDRAGLAERRAAFAQRNGRPRLGPT